MSVIELTTGGVVTAKNGSFDLYAFYRKGPGADDQPLHLAVRDEKAGVRESGGTIDMIPSGNRKTNKMWAKKRVDVESGYLKLLVKRSSGGGAFSAQMGIVMLQPRDTAPLRQLSFDLPVDASSAMSKLYIIGRFDILTPEEVVKAGLSRTKAGSSELDQYDPDILGDIINDEILEKEVAPRLATKFKVSKTGSKKTAVARVRRPRRINVLD